jgi:hypothetical protein
MNAVEIEDTSGLVNRVAQSGLITIDLATYWPTEEIVDFDLKPYLFRELILREKDFRVALDAYDWSRLQGKILAVHCTADVIIPRWAYMLIAAKATPYAQHIVQGDAVTVREKLLLQAIAQIDPIAYEGKRIVIKGCGDESLPVSAYLAITKVLQPTVQNLMYGEPCSTVPVFKRPR